MLSPDGGWIELARQRQERATTDVATLRIALDLYAADNGNPPTTEQGLEALRQRPATAPIPRNWNGPYLRGQGRVSDPWGNEYIYRCPGRMNPEGYDLISYGADGQPGGSGYDADIAARLPTEHRVGR